MIALDTNALVRMLIEDDQNQAKKVREAVSFAEKKSLQIIILSEVLIETVWVLEAVYKCAREEISQFLEILISTSTFTCPDSAVIRSAVQQYKKGGDFADLVIIGQAKSHQAKIFFSFDKKLQKRFPDSVIEKLNIANL